MAEKKTKTEKEKSLQSELVRQMITLSTSGFGLVAALAWNSLIQDVVNTYIKKFFPSGHLLSLFLYALLITSLAVLVTYQLGKLLNRISPEN